MVSKLLIVILLFATTTSVQAANSALPAFPGAQGFGSDTIGGRGGRVIEVTNLNDTGPGSFRQAAVNEKGPRVIVFNIGGVINLKSNIEIEEPFITIAGQTAPGEGVVLVGARLGIRTHDVIIRGMKVRPGDGPGGDIGSRDGIAISTNPNTKGEVYNIIIDHNSISWALDENASIWDNTFGLDGVKLHDVTYSWNIISESLRCGRLSTNDTGTKNCSVSGFEPYDRRVRSFGFLIGEDTKNITLHHNLIANNDYRNPNITQGVTLEFINNVIYNYGLDSTSISVGGNKGPENPNYLNIIGNYYKPTAGTAKTTDIDGVTNQTIKGITMSCRMANAPASRLYVYGNIDTLYRTSDSQDQWDAVTLPHSCRNALVPMKSNTSVLSIVSGVDTSSALVAYDQVLNNAGARAQGLDSVDARAVNTTKNGTSPVTSQSIKAPGARNNWFIDTPAEAGNNPAYLTVISPIIDNDHDGMPDSWENTRGGDLSPTSLAPSGYTWIEEYINSLVPLSPNSPLPPSPKPGDLNNDGSVNLLDFGLLIQKFGNPYTLLDFNAIISHYGK